MRLVALLPLALVFVPAAMALPAIKAVGLDGACDGQPNVGVVTRDDGEWVGLVITTCGPVVPCINTCGGAAETAGSSDEEAAGNDGEGSSEGPATEEPATEEPANDDSASNEDEPSQ